MSGIDVDVLRESIRALGPQWWARPGLPEAIAAEYDRITADRWAEAAERDRHPDGPRNEMGRPARVETPRERAAREKRDAG